MIACSNGTTALHLACAALALGEQDWVWVSAISFVASANCARYCGAQVGFRRRGPATGNLCVTALREKLQRSSGQRSSAEKPWSPHLAASPRSAEIGALCREYGVSLIEDACHAPGSLLSGRAHRQLCPQRHDRLQLPSGRPSRPGKGRRHDSPSELAARLRLYRSHGITRDPEQLSVASPGDWYPEQQVLGFNYRLTDIQAALGLSQLARLPQFIDRRQQLAARYDKLLTRCRYNPAPNG